MKTRTLVTFFVLLIAGLFVMSQGVAAAPGMPALPGINAPDAQPKGCIDCHINAGGKDFRLTKVLGGIKGGHPDVGKLVKTVPMDCLKCHYASAMAPVLGSMTHRNHYQNQVNNDFLVLDKGSCLSCHTVDVNSGKIGVKNAAANW
jgi:hypothetical protein